MISNTRLAISTPCAIAIAALAFPSSAPAQNRFDDVTASAGVEFHHEADGAGFPMGAGAAWVDVDNDGDDDLYATQQIGCNRLFRNNGDGSFTEVADAAGAGDCDSVSHAVAAADYDNDGDQDVYVANNGQNHLYKNRLMESGTVAFDDVTITAGMDGDGEYNTGTAVWGDYDGDRNLDLFVGNHVMRPQPIRCFPDNLWHNEGNGTFTDVGVETGVALSGVLNKAGCALAATFSDYDNDHDADLMVINDFGFSNFVPNRLFRNDGPAEGGGWTLTDISAASGFDYVQAGMGIAISDLDHDGLFDYYMTDVGDNELAHNNGDDTFTNLAADLGVLANDAGIWGWLGLVGWGTGFFDLDMDGWEDLVVCNGGAPQDKYPGMFGGADYVQLNPCYVYRNRLEPNGNFTEVHEIFDVTSEQYYRGAAFSDYDNDGDVDMYFGNLQGYNTLYRNNFTDLTIWRWLKVKTVGTLGNRDGIGARVRATADGVTHMREIDGGSSFMSRNSLTAHIGVGLATRIEMLQVTFPSGVTQELARIATNRTVTVAEPRVTGVVAQDLVSVPQGAQVVVDVTLTNHTAQGQQRDMWLVYINEAGQQTRIGGPIALTFAAGQSFTRPVRIPITPDQPPTGPRLIGIRLGAFPRASHRDHLTVDIVPAQ